MADGLIQAVRNATDEPISEMFMVIREGRGINFIEAGQHLPDFVPGNLNDATLLKNLSSQK